MYFERKRRGWLLLWGLLVAALVFCAFGPCVVAADPPNAKALARVMEVQERNTGRLFALEGVEGTATGVTPGGAPAVIVYTSNANVRGIPFRLEGVPVVVQMSGPILALKGPPANKGGNKTSVDTTISFERPVPIGVSTGNALECSAGTIGCRLTDGMGGHYALSNNHVFALQNTAPPDSPIVQPGLYDTNCQFFPADVIGTLHDYVPIYFDDFNRVDAAIALSSTDLVGQATPSNGYGTPKSNVVAPFVGQKVQKYGRTTQETRGDVTAINAIISVGYDGGIAMFVDQIIVQARKPFIKPGDSGSVLVEDPGRDTVGLLFAGTSDGKLAVANCMDNVLWDLFMKTGTILTVDGE